MLSKFQPCQATTEIGVPLILLNGMLPGIFIHCYPVILQGGERNCGGWGLGSGTHHNDPSQSLNEPF